MTRIIGGDAGSVRLRVPPGDRTRPTSEKVREAMFSALDAWNLCADTRVLDLYAGSGALGLEAASRGAREVHCVERHPATARLIRSNTEAVLRALPQPPVIHTHTTAARAFLEHYTGEAFDVVLLDPPYDLPNEAVTGDVAAVVPHLVADGVIGVERDSRSGEPVWPEGVRLLKVKKYGETTLWWLELATRESAETLSAAESLPAEESLPAGSDTPQADAL